MEKDQKEHLSQIFRNVHHSVIKPCHCTSPVVLDACKWPWNVHRFKLSLWPFHKTIPSFPQPLASILLLSKSPSIKGKTQNTYNFLHTAGLLVLGIENPVSRNKTPAKPTEAWNMIIPSLMKHVETPADDSIGIAVRQMYNKHTNKQTYTSSDNYWSFIMFCHKVQSQHLCPSLEFVI